MSTASRVLLASRSGTVVEAVCLGLAGALVDQSELLAEIFRVAVVLAEQAERVVGSAAAVESLAESVGGRVGAERSWVVVGDPYLVRYAAAVAGSRGWRSPGWRSSVGSPASDRSPT
jgi:hypothetical protein